VVTLIADKPAHRVPEAGAAFATPTIVHFGVVLLLAAVISVPWHAIGTVAVLWGIVGLSGLVYTVVVARHLRLQTTYRPVWEDWVFHVLLPCAAYALLAGAASVAHSQARPALFVVGAATLLLLFVGIHNAWGCRRVSRLCPEAGTAGNGEALLKSHRDQGDTPMVIVSKRRHMQRLMAAVLWLLLLASAAAEAQLLTITRSGSQPSRRGPAAYFTGAVRIDPLFQAHDPSRTSGASVTFEPGAHSAWHTHPLGQTLIVTAGLG
jgi:hypothetical protein